MLRNAHYSDKAALNRFAAPPVHFHLYSTDKLRVVSFFSTSNKSGLLVSFLTLKQLAKGNGKLNWALFYFHRWWRITPTYMLLLAIWMNLVLKWGHGPGKDSGAYYNYDQCKDKWWLHLLYINNLVPFPGTVAYVCIALFFPVNDCSLRRHT